jgi:hypothetical protein
MRPFIIVEGPADKLLVERILNASTGRPSLAEVFSAGGQSSAESLARTILVVKRLPVALVIDADTSNPGAVKEKRAFHETSLRSVAGKIPWHVTLMVPELEVVFFKDPQLAQSLLGPLPPLLIQLGQKAPKETLESILKQRSRTYQQFLKEDVSQEALLRLAAMDEFLRLREFVEAAHELSASP